MPLASQNYRDAALTYEQLVKFHDDEPRYKVYYAQSLYKAGLYAEVRVLSPLPPTSVMHMMHS